MHVDDDETYNELWQEDCINSEVNLLLIVTKTKLNSVALVRERTIPRERPPPVGEVSANFCVTRL